MIISASRRTDIPAFFSDWIINRLKEQYAYVRNPMNIHQVSKINLSPDIVDCIVFWSKNPKPMLEKINLQGTTILMATHNSQIVNTLKHRVIAIENGRIVRDQEEGVYGYDD